MRLESLKSITLPSDSIPTDEIPYSEKIYVPAKYIKKFKMMKLPEHAEQIYPIPE